MADFGANIWPIQSTRKLADSAQGRFMQFSPFGSQAGGGGDLGAPSVAFLEPTAGTPIQKTQQLVFEVSDDVALRADLVLVPQAGLVDEWAPGFFEAELAVPAFQNGYFVALCNRVGVEDRLTFAGESFVCGPDGSVRARAPRGEDAVLICDVDPAEVEQSHGRRTLMRDRRPDLYRDWLGR